MTADPDVVIFACAKSEAQAYERKRRYGGSVFRHGEGWLVLIDEPGPDLLAEVAEMRPVPVRRERVRRNQPCRCGCGARKAKWCRSVDGGES